MARKRAWLAVLISAVQPGLGTVYAGERGRGIRTWVAFWAILLALIGAGLTRTAVGLVASYLCLLLLAYLYPWSLIDAWRSAREPGPPSPDLAGILSLLLPGLGQAYLGLYSRGWKVWRYVAADLDPDGLHEGAGHHRGPVRHLRGLGPVDRGGARSVRLGRLQDC